LAIQGPNKGSNKYRGTVYSAAPCNNTRICIYIRSLINVLPLLQFCSRDTITVRKTYSYGGIHEELIVTSAYPQYDSDEPPPKKEVRDIVENCHSRKKQLIIGCDANAHHTLWGSTGTNLKEKA
jgi:splicing factor 45